MRTACFFDRSAEVFALRPAQPVNLPEDEESLLEPVCKVAAH